ncbi:MAG: GTP-binding protein [Desulfuromonadaceae bacterium]|nr:GTP-binding protein [Desulfuromonadaceae bacterium]
MKLITIAGPPSSGKTAVTIKAIAALQREGVHVGVVKFDSLSTQDQSVYEKQGVAVMSGLSGNLCPDHFFVSNVSDCLSWGAEKGFDLLVIESAGLCNRCAPHIQGVLAVCVIDNLSGVDTPKKIGPMLKMSDVVVITKGDIVSQAEREVFSYRVRQVNANGTIINVNGLTGQGGHELGKLLLNAPETPDLDGRLLRFSMPAALCSYCLGQRKIGSDFQMGNVKKMDFK